MLTDGRTVFSEQIWDVYRLVHLYGFEGIQLTDETPCYSHSYRR